MDYRLDKIDRMYLVISGIIFLKFIGFDLFLITSFKKINFLIILEQIIGNVLSGVILYLLLDRKIKNKEKNEIKSRKTIEIIENLLKKISNIEPYLDKYYNSLLNEDSKEDNYDILLLEKECLEILNIAKDLNGNYDWDAYDEYSEFIKSVYLLFEILNQDIENKHKSDKKTLKNIKLEHQRYLDVKKNSRKIFNKLGENKRKIGMYFRVHNDN